MPISHLLEDFGGTLADEESVTVMGDEELEDFRLTAFEHGYSAGWEDAAAAQSELGTRVRSTLAQTLEETSFTYHEAVHQLTLAMEPLFRTLIGTILPEVMAQSFGAHILAQLQEMSGNQMLQPVVLTVPPGAGAAIEGMIADHLTVQLEVVEDPGFADGQADLRIGNVERELNTTHLMQTFEKANAAFFYQIKKEARNG